MAIAKLKELIEAGAHFGNRAARWNPKMAPYIHSKKNGIHIVDLRETLKGMIRAHYFLKQLATQGKHVLFVGTKRQAADVIRQEATRCNEYFVAHRWLGGTLTNMQTMRKRIERLEQLEAIQNETDNHSFSKKMLATLARERKKIQRNFEGIREMNKLPAAMVVVDPNQEHIAVHEATRLDLPLIGIVDTDCDPEMCDFVIPANDDSLRSLQYILGKLADAVLEGKSRAGDHAARAALEAQQAEKAGETGEEPEEEEIVPEDLSSVGSFSMGGDEEED